MIYYPKKNTGPAAAVSIALYCGAALMFLISELGVPYRLVFQLAALVMLSFGIYFTSRYMLTDYKYVLKDIEKPDDKVSFAVVKVNGKRETVTANFYLESVYVFEKSEGVKAFETKHGKIDKVYNNRSNFKTNEIYSMAIEFNGMKVLFLLELSERFADEIRARLSDLGIGGEDKNAGENSGHNS